MCYIQQMNAEGAMLRKKAFIVAFIAILSMQMGLAQKSTFPGPNNQKSPLDSATNVQIRFVKSAAADYMLYLFFRSTGKFDTLEKAVPLGKIPTLDERISLPEVAASSNIASYSDLYPLIEPYKTAKSLVVSMGDDRYRILAYSYEMPSYEKVRLILDDGAAEYPAFVKYWNDNIAAAESAQIAAWKQQDAAWHPVQGLQSLARMRFPSSSLDIAALALHGSGSGNTDPEGIYTTLFSKPNLAWVVGHEGTHLLVDQFGGHNWRMLPGAQKAIQLAVARGATGDDLEEALCLLMQAKLSQVYGQTLADFRVSAKLSPSLKKDVLVNLENRWPEYQTNSRQTLIEWFVSQSLTCLSAMPVKQ